MNMLDSATVAKAWIANLSTGAAGVAMSLPADTDAWASDGFVVVEGVVGTGGVPGSRLRSPVISIAVYAATPETVAQGIKPKAPWKVASNIAEIIVRETDRYFNPEFNPATLAVSGYENVNVINAYMVTDPVRVPDDTGHLALYRFNLGLVWSSNELLNV